MKEMILALANYFRLPVMDEKGQGMVEYALILVLVSVVALVALTLIGTDVTSVFNRVAAKL
ncbi:MAG: Flp family type IVb pilin [Nitrospirota bacterium]